MTPSRVRLAGLIAPALLALVALFGVWRHVADHQSSWSGASFGMFATIDSESTRHVRANASVAEESTPVAIPEGLNRKVHEVLVLPTTPRIEGLAKALVEDANLSDADSVTVEVWGLGFDDETGSLSRFLIDRVEWEP